jgi:hypothetical protein
MNAASTSPVGNANPQSPPFVWRTWVFIAGMLFVSALAISDQSLWIDEANTALKAQQATLQAWWREMLRTGGSDMQMPLYMIWMWVCEKFFGSSEIALRVVNLFWFVSGLFALLRALACKPRFQLLVFLTAIFSPFEWYYLNEARPYAMQIGTASFMFAALYNWSEKSPSPARNELPWVLGFAAALVAISGASMLGMIWAGAAVAAAIFLTPKERLLLLARNFAFVWLIAAVSLAALGCYYLWTLHAGARASDAATTGWKNVVFIGYELFGFAGIGPGRLEIRDGGLHVFKPYAPELGLFAVLVVSLFFCAIPGVWHDYPRKKLIGLAAILVAPAGLILAAGFALHFRVLGRHFAPLFPAVIILLALGMVAAWRRGRFGKATVAAFLAFSLGSCLSLRFASRHAKDDYRSAAVLADNALAGGQKVWWSADESGAMYYHVPLTTDPADTKKAFLLFNPTRESIAAVPVPDVIIASRPDIFDTHEALAEIVAGKKFKESVALQAFGIWEKMPDPAN